MWGFIIALISGALMSVQGVFNTQVTKSSSLWAANSWVKLTAFIVCILAWFITGRQNVSGMFHMENKYMLLGGVIGAFITLTVIKYEHTWPCKGSSFDCNIPDYYCISDRGVWNVWS